MRPPSEMRRTGSGSRSNRGRVIVIVLVVAAFVLVTSLRGIAAFYTDYLWFDALGFGGVFRRILWARVGLENRQAFEAGESKAALSRQYGVSRITIKRIVEA